MIWKQDNVKTAYTCFTHSSRRCCLTYICFLPSISGTFRHSSLLACF